MCTFAHRKLFFCTTKVTKKQAESHTRFSLFFFAFEKCLPDSNNPFYKFGDIVPIRPIEIATWIPDVL